MNKPLKYILLSTLTVFSLLGITFAGLLAHEMTHAVQVPKVEAICYNFQSNWLMMTTFMEGQYSNSVEENFFLSKTERLAGIIMPLVQSILGFIAGIIMLLIYQEVRQ